MVEEGHGAVGGGGVNSMDRSSLDEIRANTCPYCGAAYTIATRGCAAKCPDSETHARLIREAIASQELGLSCEDAAMMGLVPQDGLCNAGELRALHALRLTAARATRLGQRTLRYWSSMELMHDAHVGAARRLRVLNRDWRGLP
jgi:hypothetical protein